jgi:uncharacterized protein CbrC (UPF0167 family)
MNLSFALLGKLQQYGGLKTHELNLDHGKDLCKIMGFDVPDDVVQSVLEVVQSDGNNNVLDYFFNAENVEKLKLTMARNAEAKTFMVNCDKCDGLTVKPVMAVARIEPHVVCVHCGNLIDLSD